MLKHFWRIGCGLLLLLLSLRPEPLAAQPSSIREGILGAWTFVSVVSERDDGVTAQPFGADPKGIIVFTPSGHFSLFQSRAEIPRLAANDRARASAEEAQAVVGSSIAYFGTYTVNEAERTLSLRIEASTFANVADANPQRRIITALSADELMFTNPRTPSGVTLRTAWRRASPP
jgi:hypothetical protein